jgi:dihydroneopterin triphosphate diphosphatase
MNALLAAIRSLQGWVKASYFILRYAALPHRILKRRKNPLLLKEGFFNTYVTPLCISAYVIHRINKEPRYLLIHRCCGGYLNGTWQMVTGKVEKNETAIQTALREIKEETGLIPQKLYSADAVETFFIHSLNRIIFVPVFVAFVDTTKVQLSDEHDRYEWLVFEEAINRLEWAEQRRIIAHIHEQFILKEPKELLRIQDSIACSG